MKFSAEFAALSLFTWNSRCELIVKQFCIVDAGGPGRCEYDPDEGISLQVPCDDTFPVSVLSLLSPRTSAFSLYLYFLVILLHCPCNLSVLNIFLRSLYVPAFQILFLSLKVLNTIQRLITVSVSTQMMSVNTMIRTPQGRLLVAEKRKNSHGTLRELSAAA